jgi:hypothetical protein
MIRMNKRFAYPATCVNIDAVPSPSAKYTPRPVKTLTVGKVYNIIDTRFPKGKRLIAVHCDTCYGGVKRWYDASRFKIH